MTTVCVCVRVRMWDSLFLFFSFFPPCDGAGSLNRTDVSVGIIKSTSFDLEVGVGRNFMLATDDSPSAKVAFALLVTKLAKKEDKIFIFTNTEDERDATMLDKYKVECDKLGREPGIGDTASNSTF